mmetsp:Transcript_22730/g.37603  ORF Transcript_22730/g.37603 Transcript_22730/m.37603 type:complete len:222 (-) Transcript_22730:1257-1922(-)
MWFSEVAFDGFLKRSSKHLRVAPLIVCHNRLPSHPRDMLPKAQVRVHFVNYVAHVKGQHVLVRQMQLCWQVRRELLGPSRLQLRQEQTSATTRVILRWHLAVNERIQITRSLVGYEVTHPFRYVWLDIAHHNPQQPFVWVRRRSEACAVALDRKASNIRELACLLLEFLFDGIPRVTAVHQQAMRTYSCVAQLLNRVLFNVVEQRLHHKEHTIAKLIFNVV